MKKCLRCDASNGARSFSCKKCGNKFKINSHSKKEKAIDWKSLERGQSFRVIGGTGPYYINNSNEKIYLSERGIYITNYIDNNGIHAFLKEGGTYAYIYMGPEQKSDLCYNLYRSPHKIVTQLKLSIHT